MTNQSVFITNVDQTYVELIQEILTDAGYRHVICHVGPDAFHRICNAQPDLVLLDSNLINPGRSWSTLDALRLHPKTRHIPVIICTTWCQQLSRKRDSC